jgi:nucleoid-associated protein YgaU
VNIFLSYATPYRELADDLCCRLQAVGHEVFFDREDLPAGTSFDDRIRQAIEAAELFIFLVSPESVTQGHYTRTELKLAARKWPTPGWHVLPVVVADTPLPDIPAYLRALTLMQAEGNLTAEVVMEVEDRVRQHASGRGAAPQTPPAAPKPDAGTARYRPLQLRFATRDGGYALNLPDAPDAAAITLDPAALEQALWADARPIAGSARRAGTDTAQDARLPGDAAARRIGQALYAALFDSAAGATLAQRLRDIDPQRGDGLRFVIDTTEAPELARLPWEFLYSPEQDDFLFSDRLKPVVRWLDVDAPPPSLAVEPPLRMLLAIAAPADRPELAVGEELTHLDRALAELDSRGALRTLRLEHTSLERLDQALLEHRPHVLHFIGHGDFVGDDGVLVLESDRAPGSAETIAGRQLAVLLRNYRDSLRLVFLNSCMGATVSARDPFGGVAQSLIRRGIPAVIAMQFPIPDAAAVALSRHFYRYLAAGQPVDAALGSARAFLYARGYPVEWGAPALHMRTPDGRLFDLAATPATPAARPDAPDPGATASAPPPQAPPAAAPRRGALPWVLGLLALALAGGVALLLNQPAEEAAPLPEPIPVPAPPPVVEPEPVIVPAPEPVIVPEPEPAPILPPPERLDALIEALKGPDPAAAVAELRDRLSGAAPDALAPLLDEHGDALRAALRQAESRARAEGAAPLAAELAKLRAALTPREAGGVPEPGAGLAALTAALDGPDAASALQALADRLDADPAALSPERLGVAHEALVEALVRRAEASLREGDVATGETALALLQRLAPQVDWAQHILTQIEMPAAAAAGPVGAPGYMVRRGDTLWSIAARFEGRGSAWPTLLADHNARVALGLGGEPIADPHRIRPGQWIHLRTTDPSGGAYLTYHVRPGDTLSGIAWRLYGDARRWPWIARDNPDRIDDPDRIRAGQILRIEPPRPPFR